MMPFDPPSPTAAEMELPSTLPETDGSPPQPLSRYGSAPPEAKAALELPSLSRPAVACCLCGTAHTAREGLLGTTCDARRPGPLPGHFLCLTCLDAHVSVLTRPGNLSGVEGTGGIACPGGEGACHNVIYPDDVRNLIAPEARVALDAALARRAVAAVSPTPQDFKKKKKDVANFELPHDGPGPLPAGGGGPPAAKICEAEMELPGAGHVAAAVPPPLGSRPGSAVAPTLSTLWSAGKGGGGASKVGGWGKRGEGCAALRAPS